MEQHQLIFVYLTLDPLEVLLEPCFSCSPVCDCDRQLHSLLFTALIKVCEFIRRPRVLERRIAIKAQLVTEVALVREWIVDQDRVRTAFHSKA